MRSKTGLEAMVIECGSEEEVKPIHKKFLDVSKRSKLERHRRRKSDGGSVVTRSMEAIFNGGRKREKSLEDEDRATRFSLVQHTDRNGITHIEVEQPKSYIEKEAVEATSNVQTPKMGPSQQLVAKLRSSRSSATPGKKPSEKSKFAKELESILSKELEARQTGHYRTRPPGESLSLRQRAPALLLRKLDEFEEKANQLWAKAEADEENRKIWNKPTVVIDPSKLASRTPPPRAKLASSRSVEVNLQRKERLNRIKADLLNEIRPIPNILTSNSNGVTPNVTPVTTSVTPSSAVSTPVISNTAPSTTPTTPTPSKKEVDVNNKQILVPTKTGKEPVKKLYPKDQVVPEFLHHNRGGVTPSLGAPHGAPPGPRFMLALPSPMQFTAQPHSLPLYPVTMAPMPPWARYTTATSLAPPSGDFNDTNNNLGQIWAAIPVHRGPPSTATPPTMADNQRGRSRDRSRAQMDPEQRRRAQSKSPARIPVTDKDNLSGGLTRKFREFGDAVRQRMSRKSGTANITVNQDEGGQLLKSNLKKKNDETSCGNGTSNLDTNNDNKKVHFNKFATVQMME